MNKKLQIPEKFASRNHNKPDENTPLPLSYTLNYLRVLVTPGISTRQQMAAELGIDIRALCRREQHPDWKLAREVAEVHQEHCKRENTFADYVFKQLSPESRKCWDELQFWAEHKDRQEHVVRILDGKARKIRQELFIHALVCTSYEISKALAMVGISKRTLDFWQEQDPAFLQLMEEIQWHKKNFFEKAMMDLVKGGNPLATIWVNKTVNADRGYSEKIRYEHTHNVGFTFDDLELDVDTRRKVLEAIRRRQLKQSQPAALPAPRESYEEEVQEAEVVEN